MDYTRTDIAEHLVFEHSSEYLRIPSCLYGFQNSKTREKMIKSGHSVFVHYGSLEISAEKRIREHCGGRMHINDHPEISLQHLPFESHLDGLMLSRNQLLPAVFTAAYYRIAVRLSTTLS